MIRDWLRFGGEIPESPFARSAYPAGAAHLKARRQSALASIRTWASSVIDEYKQPFAAIYAVNIPIICRKPRIRRK
jgi:hypothetical protein